MTADLVITKTVAVISDPLSSGFPIPGAVMEYTITIDNTAGSVDATAVSIADAIDSDVTFLTGVYNAGASDISFDSGASFCVADGSDGDGYGRYVSIVLRFPDCE